MMCCYQGYSGRVSSLGYNKHTSAAAVAVAIAYTTFSSGDV